MMFLKSYKLHYKMKFQDMPISIENDKGSYREWKDEQGNEGITFMAFPYGYINLTEGTDGDHVDVYIGPDPYSQKVFVVNQNVPETGDFDENKVMLGFKNAVDAKGAYLYQYDDPRFFGSMDEYDMDTFKQLLKDCKGMKIKNDNLEKAKGYPVGTIREWQGKKYKKGAKGWKPVSSGESQPLNEFPKTKGNLNSEGVPYQPTDDIDKLYSMVEDVSEDFQKFVGLLDKAVHADSIKMRKKLKSRDRVNVKVVEDYEGDVSRILDINGGTLIFNDEAGIQRLRDAVAHLQPPVIRIKDRFKKPAMGGYMDYMANVTMPNGVVVEILATTSGIMKEKSEGIGHQIYEITRALPKAKAGTPEAVLFDALIGLSSKAYLTAAANDAARSAEIGIEFNKILPVLAESIGSRLPDEVKRKNWFPDLTIGTSSQSQNVSLFDIASSINSIGQDFGLNKGLSTQQIINTELEVINMKTGQKAPLYKVKVVTAGEIMEKAKYKTRKKRGGKWVYQYDDKKERKHGQKKEEAKKLFEKPESKIDRTTQHIKNFDADWQTTTRRDMQDEAFQRNDKLGKEKNRLIREINRVPNNPANGQLKEKVKELTAQMMANDTASGAKIENPSEFMTDAQLTHFMQNWTSPELRGAAANVGNRQTVERINNLSDSELRLYAGPEASIPSTHKEYARALEKERAGGAPKPISKSRKLVFFIGRLEKGKTVPLGTRSVHGGKKVVKTSQGWKPVSGENPDTSDPRYDAGAPKGSPQEAAAKKRRQAKEKFDSADTSDPRYDKGAPKGSPQEAAAKRRKKIGANSPEAKLAGLKGVQIDARRIFEGKVYVKRDYGWSEVGIASDKDRKKYKEVKR